MSVRACWNWVVARVEGVTERPGTGWVLLGLLAALYTWSYVTHPLHPGLAAPELRQGWWSWADQTKYVEAAVALEQGRIDRESYYYPLGYSVLGAPFVRVFPAHPFFLPNLVLVLVAAALAWRLARRWLERWEAMVLTTAFLLTHAALLEQTLVIPWNTIPLQAAFFAGMWLVLARRDGRALGWLAVIAALAYTVRPSDAACFAPLLVFATLRLPSWGARVGWGLLGVLLVAAAVAGVAWLNWRTFGDWRTPYERGSFENIGFLSYPLTHKLYGLFVDGETFFGEYHTGLLWRYPWMFLVLPGAIYWLRRDGWAAVACLAAIALNWGLYISYNDFTPSAIYRFNLIHYISWAFLPLLLASVAALVNGWRDRWVQLGGVGAVVLFVAALGLKLSEKPLATDVSAGVVRALPAERPIWVKFPGEDLEKVRALTLDGRSLRESVDYQIPYVPADLRLTLSERAQGQVLEAGSGVRLEAVPQVGRFEWTWWPRWRRLWPDRN